MINVFIKIVQQKPVAQKTRTSFWAKMVETTSKPHNIQIKDGNAEKGDHHIGTVNAKTNLSALIRRFSYERIIGKKKNASEKIPI